jgi:hypothetical protein
MKEKGKLKILVDCNSNYLGFNKPTISPIEIEYFSLNDGDCVIGYQDEQEWEGIVRYEPNCPDEMQWYLDISNAKEYPVSIERMEGREEGGRSAIPIGEIRGEICMVTAMLADGMEIDLVKKYTRLSKTRLINILKNLKK